MSKIYGDLGDYECDKCTDTTCKYHDIQPPFKCSICGEEMTRRQYIESDRRYGTPLCAECEYERDTFKVGFFKRLFHRGE